MICLFPFNSFAAAGAATKYEVTMKEVELCSNVVCSNPYSVGTGAQVVDIASMTAGAEAAKFGSTAGLPMNRVFSHIRVTVNRAFVLDGNVDVSGTTCYPDGDAAGTATSLHEGSTTSTDQAETTMYIADAGDYGNDNSITMDYSPSALTYAKTMTIDGTEFTVVYELTTPYTPGPIAPKIKVSFNTSVALGAGRDNLGTCLFWPQEPYVEITLTE